MNLPPSTPIQARQNPEVYTVIIIAICVIILISLGKFIVSQFTKKNKKKPSKKILRTLTEKYHLTEKELSFLWKIIKENKVSNIAEFFFMQHFVLFRYRKNSGQFMTGDFSIGNFLSLYYFGRFPKKKT